MLIHLLVLVFLIKSSMSAELNCLVCSKQCMIPYTTPSQSAVNDYFKRIPPPACNTSPPLSTIIYNEQKTRATLVLFPHRMQPFSRYSRLMCQYRQLIMTDQDKLKSTALIEITNNDTRLHPSLKAIGVYCRDTHSKMVIYKNAHAITLRTPEIMAKINASDRMRNKSDRKVGIVLMLLDSVSLSSFYRSMPSVARYLLESGWFQLRGHHKVALNTYPNTNAILSGLFASNEKQEKRVWKMFNHNKYITMYAEDQIGEIFEYFRNRTDFQSRNLKVLLETLPSVKHINYSKCNWYFPVFERVYDQMIDFATTFRGERFFGLFVSTASSHDDISGPSMLESSMLRYMKDIDRRGIREDAILFLFGDHGLRFGPQRPLHEGSREDSMPMFWVSVPQWMQELYPDIPAALTLNKNRLTSHFDFYHTLRHIIKLNGGELSKPNRRHCALCRSVFTEVPVERKCSEAGIPPEYCFCNNHKTISNKVFKREKMLALDYIVKEMNGQIKKYAPSECLRVFNAQLVHGWRTEDGGFVITFKTNIPHRVFEGVVQKRGKKRSMTVRNLWTVRGLRMHGPSQVRDFCYTRDATDAGIALSMGRSLLKEWFSFSLIFNYLLLMVSFLSHLN